MTDSADVERETDFKYSQIRSFALATAERINDNRLHRLDEFKAVLDQILDSKAVENYKNLRRDIVDSKLEELDGEIAKQLKAEERKRVNKQSANSMLNFKK